VGPSAVLHLEQYRAPTDATKETVDDDAVLREFQASEGMPATDCSQRVMQRVRDPAAHKGRHWLFEALRGAAFGFTDAKRDDSSAVH
jgi:hypothetical protein